MRKLIFFILVLVLASCGKPKSYEKEDDSVQMNILLDSLIESEMDTLKDKLDSAPKKDEADQAKP